MADFVRSTLGNQLPVMANPTKNEQFAFRTTPSGTKVAGTTDLKFYFKSGSENITNKASVTLDSTAANADLTFTADQAGSAGDNITITLTTNSFTIAGSTTVSVSGTDITVTLENDGTSTILASANDVKAAIDGNVDAAALVDVTVEGTGAGIVDEFAQTNLDGGVNTDVDMDLDRFSMKLRTTNRPSSTEEFLIELPGPASADLTAGSYNSVNDYIAAFLAGTLSGGVTDQAAQNTAGPQFASAGFDFSFSGSGDEGMWTITVPGDAVDDQYTVTSPTSSTLTVLPGGIVYASVEVKSKDSFGNFYYWGDHDGVQDVVRSWKMYTPERADLNDDGNLIDILTVATGSDGLTYGLDFAKLSRSDVETVIDTVDSDVATTVSRDDTGDTAIQNVSDALSGETAGSVADALANEPRMLADIPTLSRLNDVGVRLQAAVVPVGVPGDTGVPGELRIADDGTALYAWTETGGWTSVTLS